MKKRIVSILFLSLATLASAATITPPACSSLGTFAAVISAESCALGGGFVLKYVSFSTTDTQASASDIDFTAFYSSLQTGVALSSGRFFTSTGETSEFVFRYTIDPQPDIISIIRGATDGAGQDSGFSIQAGTAALVGALDASDAVSILYQFCVDQPFQTGTAVCNGRPFSFVLSVPDGANTFVTFADLSDLIDISFDPTNTVGVIQTILLSNGGYITGRSGVTLDLLTDIPEPATAGLAGLGGVVLAVAAKWRRRRA